MSKTLTFYALDEEDVSAEIGDRGLYKGPEALRTLFKDQFGKADLKGNFLFPFLTTGAVQIAGDGKTAKGSWRSPCVQTVMPKDGKGEPDPIWLFGSYAGKRIVHPLRWLYLTAIFVQSISSGSQMAGESGISTGSGA